MEKLVGNGIVNNSMLNGAIEMMRLDPTPKNHTLVMEEVLKAKFICPVVLSKEPRMNMEGDVCFAEDCEVRHQMVQNAKGEPFLIAFTSHEQYVAWLEKRKAPGKCYEFVMDFSDYVNLVIRPLPNGGHGPAVGVVIDPYGCNLKVDRDMIANLVIRRMQMEDFEASMREKQERLAEAAHGDATGQNVASEENAEAK